VLLAAVIFELGSRRPFLKSIALLLGHTAAYFVAGIVLALGIESVEHRLRNPEPIDFGIELVLGVVILWVAYVMARGKKAEQNFGEAEHGPLASFGVGAVVNLIGIPFAVPYFAAISQVLKADLAWGPSLSVLVMYNLLYAMPFALVILARRVWREKADEPLRRLNAGIERASGIVMPVILLSLAGFFVADGAYYFLRGRPLVDF
jgi:cytochrome c biogenesis protein CcdA